jgi:hypothetical protein
MFCPSCSLLVANNSAVCANCKYDPAATNIFRASYGGPGVGIRRPPAGVSWGRSFRAAVMLIVYSIVWVIVGGIFIIAGIILSAGSVTSMLGIFRGVPTIPSFSAGGLLVSVLLFVIGYLIVLFGTMASFFKVQTDIITQQMQKVNSN